MNNCLQPLPVYLASISIVHIIWNKWGAYGKQGLCLFAKLCSANMVNFLQNTCNRYPIACLWRKFILFFCELKSPNVKERSELVSLDSTRLICHWWTTVLSYHLFVQHQYPYHMRQVGSQHGKHALYHFPTLYTKLSLNTFATLLLRLGPIALCNNKLQVGNKISNSMLSDAQIDNYPNIFFYILARYLSRETG